jgi:murein DD-endopeptidase MepM/ murein hydrolase activator NlpD
MFNHRRRIAALGLGLAVLLPAASLPTLRAPSSFRQGEPLLLGLGGASPIGEGRAELRNPKGELVDRAGLIEMAPVEGERRWALLLAADMDAPPGGYEVVVSGYETRGETEDQVKEVEFFSLRARVDLLARSYATETIHLNAANTELRSKPDPRKDEEARVLYAILGGSDSGAVYADGAFLLPVEGARRSAGFGDRRRYLYEGGGSDTSVHAGIDFAVVRESPVRACAAGRVVFASERIVTGKTVIIEHLPGLFSLYMHLDRIDLTAGDLVSRGGLIGLSGSTGMSTGPHLHWELRLRGKALDPDSWVGRVPLDKDSPPGKIYGAIEGG